MTLLNAVCGFTAIIFAARGMNDPHRLLLERPELTFFAASAIMIFLGMVADMLDGLLARMARSTSSFGGHLDSMSDMLTFGAAPAFLMLLVVENSMEIGHASPVFAALPGKMLWFIAVLYACCAALRLARFNVENEPDVESHMGFKGLPSPAAAGVIASLVLLCSNYLRDEKADPIWVADSLGLAEPARNFAETSSMVIIYALPFITLCVAFLMVSRITYSHAVNKLIRGQRPFMQLVWILILVIMLICKFQPTTAIAFFGFALSGPIRWAWLKYLPNKVENPDQPPASDLATDHLQTGDINA
jgi:CDP-diacylglycerol--serine O-phosphatidyltransferase